MPNMLLALQIAQTWPTVTDVIMGAGVLIATAINFRFAANVNATKLEIKNEGEKIKDAVSARLDNLEKKFIPGDLALEHRSQLVAEVKRIADETIRNRDRIHDMSNAIQTSIFSNISELTRNLNDLDRRVKEQFNSTDERYRDMEERIEECEKCLIRRGN